MAEATIDELVIEVSSDAGKAAAGFNRLVTSLSKLEGAIDGPTAKLARLADSVRRLSNSVSGLNAQKLLQLNKVKVADGLGTNLTSLADGINAIPSDAEEKLGSLAGLSALKGISGSKALGENLTSLAGGINAIPGDAYVKLSGLAVLSRLNDVKLSSTIAKNIRAIGEAVAALPEGTADRLRALAEGLSGYKALDGVRITAAINGIKKLPEAMEAFEGLDIDAFAEGMAKLNAQIVPLAKSVRDLADSINELPPSYRTAGKAASSVKSANKQLASQLEATGKKADSLGDRLKKLFNTAAIVAALRTVISKIGECVNAVSDYVEDMNLYAASMGEFAEAGANFATQVQSKMGIDAGEWMRFQGVLQSIGTGFGITNDRMAVMSQNMTQLGYDLASFYNLDIDEAMRKVQSGFAGELEPMRRIGYDLSVARMEIERTNLGIEKSVADMTQAEKAALRYHLMMTQLTQTHGDMARTINSPANQLRVLRAQLTLAARAIGNVFIPMLNAILPYAIAAAKAIQTLAQTVAKFFGLDTTFEVDYSSLDTSGIGNGISTDGLDDLGDSASDAGDAVEDTKKKVDELKRSVMGFDELNKLTDDSSNDDSSGKVKTPEVDAGALGSVLDQIPMETYDFMKGLDDYLSKMTDELAEKIGKLLPLIAAVAAGLAAWKIADALLPDTLKGIDRFKKLLGIAMAVAGAIIYLHGVWDAWVNGMNLDNLLQMLVGMGLVVGGLALAFGRVGAAIGLLVTGLGLFVTSIHDAVVNGCNWFNVLGATIGGVAMVVGSFLLGLTGPITALIGIVSGAIMVVVGFVDAWNNGLDWENLAMIIGGTMVAAFGAFMGGLGPVAITVAALVGGVAALVLGFKDFLENGPTPENTTAVVAGIMLIGGAIALLTGSWIPLAIAAVVGLVAALAMNWEAVSDFVNGMLDNLEGWLKDTFGPFGEWLSTYVVEPIRDSFNWLGEFFGGLWTGIIEATHGNWEPLGDWFGTFVIQPIVDRWNEFVGIFTGLFDAILAIPKDGGESLVYWMGDFISTALSSLFIGPLHDIVKGGVESLWNAVADFAKPCRDAVNNFLLGIVQGIFDILGGIAQWIHDNVIQPIVDFWTPIIDWWSQLLGSLKATSDAIWHNIGVFIEGIWMLVQRVWEVAGQWFDEHVLQPVQNFFSEKWEAIKNKVAEAWDNITEKAANAWADIQNKWSVVAGWFEENVAGPIRERLGAAWDDAVSRAQQAWSDIQSAFSQFGEFFGGIVSEAWQRIKAAFQWGGQIFDGVVDAITGAFTWMMNGLIDGLNWAISQPFDGLNSIIRALRDWEILDIRPFAGFWEVPVPQIPYLASGGQVTSGQLFVARENGIPEMVGEMGGKSTVANNQQIVEGISQGVANAMFRVLATQRASEGGETTIEIPLYINREELSRAVYKGDLANVRRGVMSPVYV